MYVAGRGILVVTGGPTGCPAPEGPSELSNCLPALLLPVASSVTLQQDSPSMSYFVDAEAATTGP